MDLDEAYGVAREAVMLAHTDGTGWMATLLREPGTAYRIRYDKVPLASVANSVRQLPPAWLSDDGLDVTDAFVDYARPLIGDAWPAIEIENGLQRFARFKPRFVPPCCPAYIPQRKR